MLIRVALIPAERKVQSESTVTEPVDMWSSCTRSSEHVLRNFVL